MSNLDELKKRKEQLLLEQEVAKLERKQQLGTAGNWSWWWVGPLAAVGAFLFLVGLDKKDAVPIAMAFFALIPVVLKFYFNR